MTECSPILVFAFRRPAHLKRTLDALARSNGAGDHPLIIYCDGPRDESDLRLVEATKEVAKAETRFLNTEVVSSDFNKGLARSIIEGVSSQLAYQESVIVLEDDIEVSFNFLNFMRLGLKRYAYCDEVASVCGYMYPIDEESLPPTFCLKGTDCWGWGTWRRAWQAFEPNGELLLYSLIDRGLCRDFDLDNRYPYVKMLRDQISGRNNSWAIRWHASAYLRGMVSIFPRKSLVRNFGFDGSGSHCVSSQVYDVSLPENDFIDSSIFTRDLSVNRLARERIGEFFVKEAASGLRGRFSSLARKISKFAQLKIFYFFCVSRRRAPTIN